MERQHTKRESDLLRMAAERFGEDAKFTYVNREKKQIVTLTLNDALDACKYIVDESNDEVMQVLEGMLAMTEKLAVARQAKLAQQALSEGRA